MKEWLDRRVIQLPCYYRLVLSEKDFNAEMKRLKMNPVNYMPSKQADACCTFLECNDGKRMVLVCMRENRKATLVEVYGMLVHEATHIWQDWCEHVGEHNPGKETEAYAIQSISQELIASYNKQKRIKIR